MLHKKNFLFLISFGLLSTVVDVAAKKELKGSGKASVKPANYSTKELLSQAQKLFDEFKKMTGIDLVAQIGQVVKNGLKNQGKLNDPMANLSAEEITIFFAPMQLMVLVQQALQTQEDADNNKASEAKPSHQVVAMMNEFCHELYMSNMALYLKFKSMNNDAAAYEMLSNALQNLGAFIFKMMQVPEDNEQVVS